MAPNLSRDHLQNEIRKILADIRDQEVLMGNEVNDPYERLMEVFQKGFERGWNELAEYLGKRDLNIQGNNETPYSLNGSSNTRSQTNSM